MKRALGLLLLAVFQYPCSAAYSYYQTYNGTPSGFSQNGSLTNVSTPYGPGVTSSATTGGSLVSSLAVPDGSELLEGIRISIATLHDSYSGINFLQFRIRNTQQNEAGCGRCILVNPDFKQRAVEKLLTLQSLLEFNSEFREMNWFASQLNRIQATTRNHNPDF